MLRSVRVCCALLTAVLATTSCDDPPPASSGEPQPRHYASQLTDATNALRESRDLRPLDQSQCLMQAAHDRAQRLVGKPLTHAPLQPVAAACGPEQRVGENLVNGDATPDEVVDAWMSSPGHRSNLIDPNWLQIGIGCVPDGDGLVCSQLFLGAE